MIYFMDDFMKGTAKASRRKVKAEDFYPQITLINADEILLPPAAAESPRSENHNPR